MDKILEWFSEPKHLKNIHGVLVIMWIALIPPTLIFWPESVTWVALMSIWANIAAHAAAWQASRTEVAEKENQS